MSWMIDCVKKDVCSKCNINKVKSNKRYCNECHAQYMREWRKTHRLSGEPRLKAITRAKTKMLVRRGKLIKQPCAICGCINNIEAHHEDYTKPMQVIWLCVEHHRKHHATMVSRESIANHG